LKNKQFNFPEGELLLINKPIDWTSFDVVNKIRNLIKKSGNIAKIKVGHAGTLDPLATGLLIVGTGKFTKRLQEFQDYGKEYTGAITLGATTPSFDLETEIDQKFSVKHIKESQIHETVKQFIGEQMQLPPLFSAKKVEGKKAYISARKGKDLKMNPQKITIYEFEITGIEMPDVHFRIHCSKGTYIRSIASDFGKALKNGAHLSALCRTKIGKHLLDDALEISEFELQLSGQTVSLV